MDEIQECPDAVTALKFLEKEKNFDIIASGSMLGIDYKRPTSYPVGSIQYINMFSLSFKEFLYASGVTDDIISELNNCFLNRSMVPWAIHDKIMEYLRLYMIIGGMPEAVNLYFENASIADADKKIRDILNDYRYDIAHYAKADIKIKAESCYFSLPNQLSKENHKFMYSNVEKGGTSRKYASSIDWLTGAYMVKMAYNISGYDLPLSSRTIKDNFRVYPTDIGLLVGMFDLSVKESILHPENDTLNPMLKGGLYESLVADMLIKNGHSGLYFKKNETSTFEIEFLVEKEHRIIPIEVKSGNWRYHSSIDKFRAKFHGYIGTPCILYIKDVQIKDGIPHLPIFMAMFL